MHDWCLCVQVAELVTSEFFEQGDRERSELKLTPAVIMLQMCLLLLFFTFFRTYVTPQIAKLHILLFLRSMMNSHHAVSC